MKICKKIILRKAKKLISRCMVKVAQLKSEEIVKKKRPNVLKYEVNLLSKEHQNQFKNCILCVQSISNVVMVR